MGNIPSALVTSLNNLYWLQGRLAVHTEHSSVWCDCPTNGQWAQEQRESLITSTEHKSMMALTAPGVKSNVPLPDAPHVREQLAEIPLPSAIPPLLWEEGEKQEHTNSLTVNREIAYQLQWNWRYGSWSSNAIAVPFLLGQWFIFRM